MENKRKSYPIREWPESDRPREKLLQRGADVLTDTELLAIILRTGDAASGTSAIDQARSLLGQFPDFRALAGADSTELCKLRGIGPATAAAIQAVMEISRRYASAKVVPRKRLGSSADVFAHFHEQLRDKAKECFFVVLVDAKNCATKEVKISEGTLTSSLVHPREVFTAAVKSAAASIILVHNHPSGDPAPSREDEAITKRLVAAGGVIGLEVLDHVIIGQGRYFSFADEGRLV